MFVDLLLCVAFNAAAAARNCGKSHKALSQQVGSASPLNLAAFKSSCLYYGAKFDVFQLLLFSVHNTCNLDSWMDEQTDLLGTGPGPGGGGSWSRSRASVCSHCSKVSCHTKETRLEITVWRINSTGHFSCYLTPFLFGFRVGQNDEMTWREMS